jgi:hypothetical protein
MDASLYFQKAASSRPLGTEGFSIEEFHACILWEHSEKHLNGEGRGDTSPSLSLPLPSLSLLSLPARPLSRPREERQPKKVAKAEDERGKMNHKSPTTMGL